MLAFVPLWILIMAMIWEQIKLDKKHMKEFEEWRKNCRAYEQALKEKNNG